MEGVTIIGVDLAKRSFQLHGSRADGSTRFDTRSRGYEELQPRRSDRDAQPNPVPMRADLHTLPARRRRPEARSEYSRIVENCPDIGTSHDAGLRDVGRSVAGHGGKRFLETCAGDVAVDFVAVANHANRSAACADHFVCEGKSGAGVKPLAGVLDDPLPDFIHRRIGFRGFGTRESVTGFRFRECRSLSTPDTRRHRPCSPRTIASRTGAAGSVMR